MNRRTVLKYGVASGAAALFGRVLGYDSQGPLTSAERVSSIEEMCEGGSAERRSLLGKLENEQVLTRHLGNTHSLPEEGPIGERNKVTHTLRELVRHTNPDAPRLYGAGEVSLEEAIVLCAPHLSRFSELSRTTAMDDRFMVAKIARESNGDVFANTGALGLTQVEPPTYSDHVRWARLSVASNRAVLPSKLYESFVEDERPLRDALLFTPELARQMGLSLEKRSIGRSDAEYLDRWLPFGIVLEKYHNGRFPANGGVYETLLTPDTSITSGGLVALSYLLRLNHVTKTMVLDDFNYDPAQVLARSLTPADALAAAFNGGDGRAVGRLMDAVLTADDTTSEAVAHAYDIIDPQTRDYRSKVLSSTGALQRGTRGSVSELRDVSSYNSANHTQV